MIARVSSGLREVYRKRVWEKYEKRERERERERERKKKERERDRETMEQLSRNRWDKKNQEK